jgi:H+/Cl- antiporter ClcA
MQVVFLLFAGLSIALMAGTASAFFLWALEQMSTAHANWPDLVWGLPLAGLALGYVYQTWGASVRAGNKQLLAAAQAPEQAPIPWRMAPLILFSTLLSHLFGASVGREGTAVQMGGAVGDQFYPKLGLEHRPLLLSMGMAAGFASVFGTPLAGLVFALEVLRWRLFGLANVFWLALVAFAADAFCDAWGASHSHYAWGELPRLGIAQLGSLVLAAMAFGLTARLYLWAHGLFGQWVARWVVNPIWRPFWGGLILALLFGLLGLEAYRGLGLPALQAAFEQASPVYFFALKLFLTAFTLAVGFKGGEVTPLFLMGASLGSALSVYLPLPLGLLAAMGFVAVFGAASGAPLASALMGLELFGYEGLGYWLLATLLARAMVGNKTLYD